MKVDILHHVSKFHPLNGNIFYHFEYFIFLLQRGVDVRLVFTPDYDISEILPVMEDRYNLDNIDYKSRIYTDGIVKAPNLITNTKVLLDLCGNIRSENIHLVNTWASIFYKDEIKLYKKRNIRNIIEYNECPEIGRVNYIRPIYFDLLRKPKQVEKATFLHLSGVRHIDTREYIKYVFPIVGKEKVIISYPKSQEEEFYFLGLSNIESYVGHVPNLFEKFDAYFYILLRGRDYSPRMLVESAYMGKKIIYINKMDNESSKSRYKDCLDGNFKKYEMNENDILLRNFL
jgi:hypothetical protein